jgi:hypothetical protein
MPSEARDLGVFTGAAKLFAVGGNLRSVALLGMINRALSGSSGTPALQHYCFE